MISVQRGVAPDGLITDSINWLAEYRALRAQDARMSPAIFWSRVRKRQHMKSYAAVLSSRFHHKCAFCESLMKHVTPPHVEHFKPKDMSIYESEIFSWDNWLLACPECNSSKGKTLEVCNNQFCLLDPTYETPSAHLVFRDADILHLTARGERTIRKVKLDRVSLIVERGRWLSQVRVLLLICVTLPEEHPVREQARNLLIWSMQDEAPYTAMTTHLLGQVAPSFANPTQPHPHMAIDEPIVAIQQLVNDYADSLRVLQ